MTLKYLHTRLLVKDFKKSFLFYRDVLGMDVHIGDERGPYAELKNDHTMLALFARNLMEQAIDVKGGNGQNDQPRNIALIFSVPNVDETHKDLAAKGAQFVFGLTDRPDWFIRTAHLSDPDGNLIEINSPLK
jgi:lactoylglutathione lyase